MLQAAAVAFATVFVAELGDKSQLLALSLAARYPTRLLLAAVATASALMMGAAVAVGSAVGRFVPTEALSVAAGLLFLAFAVVTWRDGDDGEEEERPVSGRSFTAAVSAIVLAELGDKTMFTALALAATSSAAGVWLGASLGMAAAGSIGVLVGASLWKRLSPRTVRLASAVLFAAVGIFLVVGGLLA